MAFYTIKYRTQYGQRKARDGIFWIGFSKKSLGSINFYSIKSDTQFMKKNDIFFHQKDYEKLNSFVQSVF